MEFGVFDLELIVDFFFVEEFGLHLLDFIEVVFDEREVLPAIEVVHFDFCLGVVRFELLDK